jgi:hypothetical protein
MKGVCNSAFYNYFKKYENVVLLFGGLVLSWFEFFLKRIDWGWILLIIIPVP